MKLSRLLFLFTLLCACDAEVTFREPTQVTLRAWATDGAAQGTLLGVRIVTLRAGKWVENPEKVLTVPKDGWPVDVPIVPGEDDALDTKFEVIARALDANRKALAEARVITSFVPRDQRLLELQLAQCGADLLCEFVGDADGYCRFGMGCKTCVPKGRTCGPTPERPGSSLDPLYPEVEAKPDFIEAAPDAEVSVEPPDAGAPDAATDAGQSAGEDASVDAGEDAGPPPCPMEPRCLDPKRRQYCNGSVLTQETCTNACVDGACGGDCSPDSLTCSETDPLVPQVCNDQGEWEPNTQADPDGKCDYKCDQGTCVGECVPVTAMKCEGNDAFVCTDEATWSEPQRCEQVCENDACAYLPSCLDGSSCASGKSCCATDVVPGGEFLRSIDFPPSDDEVRATISSFRMDRYEVTVSRFRRWMAAYATAKPVLGAGANPNNDQDQGWQSEWDAFLQPDADAMATLVLGCADHTFTEAKGDNEDKPMNCVTWYEAQAFCIWDRGRLPTEAEWNYAAAGGNQQRFYPWSTEENPTGIDGTYAVYNTGDPSIVPAPLAVSSKLDVGFWGHADLGGNVQEWVQDWYQDYYAVVPCNDCADLTPSGTRVVRGGTWSLSQDAVANTARSLYNPARRNGKVGFRCARQLSDN